MGFSSDHAYNPTKQKIVPPVLLSPEQVDYSKTEEKSTNNACAYRTCTDDKICADDEIIGRAVEFIWSSFCGQPTESYPTFHFKHSSSFDSLRERLEEHVGLSRFVDDKIRLDWNADTCDLILRLMPTFVHDIFRDSVKLRLEEGLNSVAQAYPELEATRRKIIPGGHSDVTGQGVHWFNKSPDGQFLFKGATISPFLLEVAYSKEERALLNKLDEYFTAIPGCTVLSFDLNYADPSTRRTAGYTHSASVSLATSMRDIEDPELAAVDELVEEEIFREAGRAVQGTLEIPFELFVPVEQRSNLPVSAAAASVCVNFADLARILSDAEKEQRVRNATPEPRTPLKGVKWRKRNGEVKTRYAPGPKRPQTRSQRTRSQAGPRRSQRLRSASTESYR
ncbi:hypothetical protein O1611_g8072 [Lasiodiplodia mahajangana]|uniref:Uncharacterized protein n=1 Tax=Lasiodiplodia mahajangana TaxID=1108764 RepID=A0ACC2JDV0_9PEZI|nr:hypothetical protein O1611_g8072 [Lasiodiplodia mahajangana]